MIVENMEALHRDEGDSLRDLCVREGVAYGNVMRWKGRRDRGEAAVSPSGPKKVAQFDLDALREQIGAMDHHRKRSAGAGELYRQNRDGISRRDLARLIAEERRRKNRERDSVYHRVNWKVPCLMWALDDTEYHPDKAYPKAYLHNVQDLGSRYKFEPLVRLALAHGEDVAANLNDLFEQHGPPLFLKRDNGGNLNHHLVEELLEAFFVIPINSPIHYPQYNGGIEAAQCEIKARLAHRATPPSAFLAIQAGLDVQALNHLRRPCLQRRTACQVFLAGAAFAGTFNRRKRKEVYDIIHQNTVRLIDQEKMRADDAWRLSVEMWLLDNGFITVSKKQNVSPGFPENRTHN